MIRNVDLREYLTEEAQVTEKNTTYDLVANVVHDGKPTEGAYRIHVLHHVSDSCVFFFFFLVNSTGANLQSFRCAKFLDIVKENTHPVQLLVLMCAFCFWSLKGTGKWYELQDLQVTDILPQMITLSEAYIQVSSIVSH